MKTNLNSFNFEILAKCISDTFPSQEFWPKEQLIAGQKHVMNSQIPEPVENRLKFLTRRCLTT